MTTLMCRGKAINNCSMWLDYLTNQSTHETGDIVATYDTFGSSELTKNEPNKEMWQRLFEQNERAYNRKSNRGKTDNGKLQSARESVVWLNNKWCFDDEIENKKLAQSLAVRFKQKYGLDCVVALHWNKSKTNFHAHIMYADRKTLDKPIEIKATRNEYYTDDWKRCKKTDAVHIVKKGDIKETKYFEDIKDSRCTSGRYRFLKHDLKPFLAKLTGQKVFDHNSLKIAQKKVKKEYTTEAKKRIKKENQLIKEYNQKIDYLNKYEDFYDQYFDENICLNALNVPHYKWNDQMALNSALLAMRNDLDLAWLKVADTKKEFEKNRKEAAKNIVKEPENTYKPKVWKRVYDSSFNQNNHNKRQLNLLESVIAFLLEILGILKEKETYKTTWYRLEIPNYAIYTFPDSNLSQIQIGDDFLLVSNQTIRQGYKSSDVFLDLNQKVYTMDQEMSTAELLNMYNLLDKDY